LLDVDVAPVVHMEGASNLLGLDLHLTREKLRDLLRALEEKWIAYAGPDVLETEPPGNNNPLLGMTNVILSAHTASASARFDPARKRHVGRELALVLEGRWPMSCVNPAVLMNSKLRRWQPVSMERGPNS